MRRSVLALLLVSLAAAGCTFDQQPEAEAVGSAEDELALASLYGTWQSQSGAFLSITFTRDAAQTLGGGLKGRRFEAVIDTGIRCITTPCPSTQEVSGVYKLAHGTQLTLASYDKPSREFAAVLGEYSVKIKNKDLVLTKRDRSSTQTIDKVVFQSATRILSAAQAHAWPSRDPEYVYRTFDTRAAAEAWGNTQSSGKWLAKDGETTFTSHFVSGTNDLWSQEFTVDKRTLEITITGEH
jgi:hypothetical protein